MSRTQNVDKASDFVGIFLCTLSAGSGLACSLRQCSSHRSRSKSLPILYWKDYYI